MLCEHARRNIVRLIFWSFSLATAPSVMENGTWRHIETVTARHMETITVKSLAVGAQLLTIVRHQLGFVMQFDQNLTLIMQIVS